MSTDLVLTVTLSVVGGASMTLTQDEVLWLASALDDFIVRRKPSHPAPERVRLSNKTGQLIVERTK
jgi:hypothetical protein